MELENYISDLLYRYECVILPNFGAFLSQNTSACLNKNTSVFYPPKKVISFNSQIKDSDGLLIRYIADVEKIPFESASKQVNQKVIKLKSLLAEGKTIYFDTIGSFSLNNEHQLVFEPSHHLNFLTDAFGLSEFASPIIHREVYNKTVKSLEATTPVYITKNKRQSRPYLKYVAIALIALTAAGFGLNNHLNKVKVHNEYAQEEANSALETKIQQATFSISTPLPALTLKVNKQTGNYHIIAGAFRIEENSKTRVKQLKKQGFNARLIGKSKNGLYQVAYSSHSSRQEALLTLKDIRSSKNADAWLLVKKK